MPNAPLRKAGADCNPSPAAGRPRPFGCLLLACLVLSISAFAARNFWIIGALALIDGVFALAVGLPAKKARRWIGWFFWQSVVIVGLYALRWGADGLLPGLRVSCQILLAFVPFQLAMFAVPHSQMVRHLGRVMPDRSAFVLATSLRFVPVLKKEFMAIYQVQRLRGAKIAPADLVDLRNWPDLLHCLFVPFVVQAFKLAEGVATAARIRYFETTDHRTYWPGDDESDDESIET